MFCLHNQTTATLRFHHIFHPSRPTTPSVSSFLGHPDPSHIILDVPFPSMILVEAQEIFTILDHVNCDLQGRKIKFTNSKTLVGWRRDRPERALPLTLPNVKNLKNEKKRKTKKKRKETKGKKKPWENMKKHEK